MSTKILLFIIIIVGIFLIFSSTENFMDLNSNMIEFTKLDGSLIKKIKLGSSNSLYDNDVLDLFKQDEVIRVHIPNNYSVSTIYKFKNTNNFAKTVELADGFYDIQKSFDDKIISQIDIRNNLGLNQNIISDTDMQYVMVRNYYGDILYRNNVNYPIDWDQIYSQYGYDNYYVNYPTGIISPYYYYNHPRYKLYNPSNYYNHYNYYNNYGRRNYRGRNYGRNNRGNRNKRR